MAWVNSSVAIPGAAAVPGYAPNPPPGLMDLTSALCLVTADCVF